MSAPSISNPLRVLVVDDHAINRLLLVRAVESFGGNAHTAENGREALALMAAERFDLVLMDIAMPVLDGEEATRQARAGGMTAPIVAVTAHYGAGDLAYLQRIGFTALIPKPIDLRAVSAQMAAARVSHG